MNPRLRTEAVSVWPLQSPHVFCVRYLDLSELFRMSSLELPRAPLILWSEGLQMLTEAHRVSILPLLPFSPILHSWPQIAARVNYPPGRPQSSLRSCTLYPQPVTRLQALRSSQVSTVGTVYCDLLTCVSGNNMIGPSGSPAPLLDIMSASCWSKALRPAFST